MTQLDEHVPTGNRYDKYGSTNPIERRMMRGFLAAFDAMLENAEIDRSPQRILEIGVGEGVINRHVSERYPAASVLGLDLPDDGLADHWSDGSVVGLFGDATALPFPDDAFDLVLAIEVLEHVADPDHAVQELARVCAGSLIASVPFEPIWRLGNMTRGRYLRDLGNTPGHVNHWTNRGFRRMVGRRFDITRTANPMPWTMLSATPIR